MNSSHAYCVITVANTYMDLNTNTGFSVLVVLKIPHFEIDLILKYIDVGN